jgi:transcription initiation factor TFIID subunit 12
MADDFIENVTQFACLIAKHRKARTLEVRDAQLHLERNWNIRVSGFGTDEVRGPKKASISDAHRQRLILVKKAMHPGPSKR